MIPTQPNKSLGELEQLVYSWASKNNLRYSDVEALLMGLRVYTQQQTTAARISDQKEVPVQTTMPDAVYIHVESNGRYHNINIADIGVDNQITEAKRLVEKALKSLQTTKEGSDE